MLEQHLAWLSQFAADDDDFQERNWRDNMARIRAQIEHMRRGMSKCHDPQGRVQMLERALRELVEAIDEQLDDGDLSVAVDPTDRFVQAMRDAKAWLAYKPAQINWRDGLQSKVVDALTGLRKVAACKHEFEYLCAYGTNGVVGRCIHCKCRFTAWPTTLHYDEIVAAKGRPE